VYIYIFIADHVTFSQSGV